MAIDIQVLNNTFEQFLLFLGANIGLSVYLPAEWLWIIPTNSIVWLIGRVLFFTGYHIDPSFRAPGFAMTLLPILFSTLYCCVQVAIE